MLNYKLKSFLKFLRSNKVIEEYELLFDRVFNYSLLLELSDESVARICSNQMPSLVLYEEVNDVKISDNIYQYIIGLKSKELQKYAIRIAISGKYSDDESLRYIREVCDGNSVASSRYAYSVIMNDKIKENKNKDEYVSLVAKSEENTSMQIRDFILEGDFLSNDNNVALIRCLSDQKDYVAHYMIKLYKETKDIIYIPLLSLAVGETQARYTYEVLSNKKVMESGNGAFIALVTAESEMDDAYKLVLMIRDGDYDNLYEKAKSILNKEAREDIDVDELFKTRNLDTIISKLSYIDMNKDIKLKVKK